MLRLGMKQAVLTSTGSINYRCRLFCLSSKHLIRKVASSHKSVEKNIEQLITDGENPNINFFGVENDIGVITLKPQAESSMNNLNEFIDQNARPKSKEKLFRTSFGIVRNDSDNNLRFHGQYDKQTDLMFPHASTEFSNVVVVSAKDIPHLNTTNYSTSNTISDIKPYFRSSPHSTCTSDLRIERNVKKSETNYQNLLDKQINKVSIKEQLKISEEESEDVIKPANEHLNFYKEITVPNNNFSEIDICDASPAQNENPSMENEQYVTKLNFIDESYFINTSSKNFNEYFTGKVMSSDETNFIDEKYFESITTEQNTNKECSVKNSEAVKDLNFIDEMYFETNIGMEQNFNKECFIKDKATEKFNLLKDTIAPNEIESNFSSDDNLNENVNLYNSIQKNTFINEDGKTLLGNKSISDESDVENEKIFSQKPLNYHIPNMNNINDTCLSKDSKTRNNEFTHKNMMSHFREKANTDLKKEKIKLQEKIPEIVTDSKLQLKRADLKNNTNENNQFVSNKTSKLCSDKSVNNVSYEKSDSLSSAHDYLTKLRNDTYELTKAGIKILKNEKLDSKGFRILKNQVLDLSHFTRDEIIKILKNNILYIDNDLLILNKPYNLIIHDSQTNKTPSLESVLGEFAKEIDPQSSDSKLFTVHRIDKETTGCLLLARNETMADNLKSLFAQRKIIKKYWIITANVPEQLEGIIDIPVAEGSVGGKKRMVLHPKLPDDVAYHSHSRSGKRAVTAYKVLSISGNAALIEATPETGIKHQIRVHFGFGLSCPILGDHKYSHLDKLVPQKLPSDMLQRLQVRQSKVRHIPMHIHARSIAIPSYVDGRNLFIMAPPPHHMRINMKRLRFKRN